MSYGCREPYCGEEEQLASVAVNAAKGGEQMQEQYSDGVLDQYQLGEKVPARLGVEFPEAEADAFSGDLEDVRPAVQIGLR